MKKENYKEYLKVLNLKLAKLEDILNSGIIYENLNLGIYITKLELFHVRICLGESAKVICKDLGLKIVNPL